MSKVLKLLSVLFAVLISVNIGIYFYFSERSKGFYKSSEINNSVFTKEPSHPELSGSGINETQISNATPEYISKQIENLKFLIPSLFVKIKNGVKTYPALVVKTKQENDLLNVFLLTFYPMEWQFAKLNVKGFSFFPETVYLCANGVVVLKYRIRGTFLEKVETGYFKGHGLIAVPEEGINFSFEPLTSQPPDCSENGFVFNLEGDFSGVCFGGKFLSVNDLEDLIPSQCQIIFQEGKDGNLQG
jgi:hypothetical protein